MERVTHIDKDGWYINGADVAAVFHSGTGEIRMSGKDIDRLAAYEETGLEPEDFERAFNKAAVLKLAGQALGITPDRLRELAKADREGRCVVLPFKPPRWVYVCSTRFPKPAQAHYASAINVLQDMDKGCVFGDTPEEAAAALRRE